MAINPNPARVTTPMWRLWDERPNKAWRLGGIWAGFKKGYHNSVINNKRDWPGNYSIRFPLDLVSINNDKARAIDVTMSDSEMIKWTTNMKNSALNPNDHRLDAVREFYGTLDGKTVYGLIKDSADGVWRRASADLTHLWHGHMGVFTYFVNNWNMIKPILSVWRGETLTEWETSMFLPEYNDVGETVKYWQNIHNVARKTVTPNSPELKVDGDYGDVSAAAFADFWKKTGGQGDFNGRKITGWLGVRYHRAFVLMVSPPVNPVVVTDAQVKAAVNEWLTKNTPEVFNIEGTIKGVLTK
jgi:hypothetical protein